MLGNPVPVEMIAISAVNFLTSTSFKCSDWFRGQRVHSFAAVELSFEGSEEFLILGIEKNKFGHTIVALTEVSLPENYPDVRVIEESKFIEI